MVEHRSGSSTATGETAQGVAIVYNTWTVIGGLYREKIAPGAINSLRDNDVRALLDHDWGRVIGRQSAGTLRLDDRRDGLWVEIDLDDRTPDGQTALGTIARRDISGMSFGFRVTDQEWANLDSGMPERTVTGLDLFEVSAVSFPAFETTSIALRSPPVDLDKMSPAKRLSVKRALAEHKFRGIN